MKRLILTVVAVICITCGLLLMGYSMANAGDGKSPEPIERLRATLLRAVDGDTYVVRVESIAFGVAERRVRLGSGVDTPERKQPWGPVATKKAEQLLADGFLAQYTKKSTYGRAVADLILPGGKDLGYELVSLGLAWLDERYVPKGERGERLRKALEKARAARLGLWADPNPTPPWKWGKRGKK